VPAGQLLGKHITEIGEADPRLIERAWDQLKRDQAWVGDYRMRDPAGNTVRARTYNFVHHEWDGQLLFVAFDYRIDFADRGLESQDQIHLHIPAEDICTAQLCVDGYSDEDIGLLLGIPVEQVNDLVARMVKSFAARSKTEACVRAMKARLVT
jgi:hypothetical protein